MMPENTVKQSPPPPPKSKPKESKERIPIKIVIPPDLDTPSELQLRHDIEEMYNNSENRYHITYEQMVPNVDDLLNLGKLKESSRENWEMARVMGFKKRYNNSKKGKKKEKKQ